MLAIRCDRYYRYAELTEILQDCAAAYPHLVSLSSIGRSYEGRDLWLLTVTHQATGPAAEKPALWIDGNIHATELAPTTACLHLLQVLLNGYGDDAEISRCLDTRAFYICPRVNPDGAEWALAEQPRLIRSGTRPYPDRPPQPPGLQEADIDGDGRILMMRIPDPNGAWEPSPDDPRLLVRRSPTAVGGQYYRVLPEGYVEHYDGVLIDLPEPPENIDFNRNFPIQWRPECEQAGAGPFPTSEPEVRSLVEFVTRHTNITGVLAFHTMGGLLLRPYSHQSDEKMPPIDLQTYQKIGVQGTKMTGYPALSVYHHYRSDAQQVTTGAFDDWAYEERGIFAWTVEVWSPLRYLGIAEGHPLHWYNEHDPADDLATLQWSDEELQGEGYVDWYAYEHPQLGRVELGGWNDLFTWRNPPPSLLESEVARFPDWAVWNLLISPRLELYEASYTALGSALYRVRLAVQNTGWLPSAVTQKAADKKIIGGCVCSLTLPTGARLVAGDRE
ncbi:MAG: carboxypeptidase, partial [Spirulinaceae cyanobacterium RM2_2_10]|nr:carboxypeptidase [Spirulinaceae cyanobacterium RM2_2_10]